jgi:nucleotide-binding universal stress UspA family protein
MAAYQTVVVGTDGSKSSFAAVDRAASVAADSGATLVIACAYYPAGKNDVEKAQDAQGRGVPGRRLGTGGGDLAERA